MLKVAFTRGVGDPQETEHPNCSRHRDVTRDM